MDKEKVDWGPPPDQYKKKCCRENSITLLSLLINNNKNNCIPFRLIIITTVTGPSFYVKMRERDLKLVLGGK